MFFAGALPALLVVYIRGKVEESPAFLARATVRQDSGIKGLLRGNAKLFLYAVLLMTAFNFLSHGTQDLYPAFLSLQHHFPPRLVGLIATGYNIGAIPLWAYGTNPLMLASGAFFMQFAVQGAWGIVPAHLNELSPHNMRGTFPGFVYQTGNLLASANATLQAWIAEANGGNYAFALSLVTAIVALALAGLTLSGIEARGVKFHGGPENPEDG
jgi:SHS family lactate transporter-like MFS transporter